MKSLHYLKISVKRVCCREMVIILVKIDGVEDSSILSITEHSGFNSDASACGSLKLHYFQYQQERGYTAYHQLTI